MDSKLRCLFELPVESAVNASVSQSSAALLKNESSLNDSIQSASSAGDSQKSGEFDFARAAAEVRELREEGSQLRQENIELKVSVCNACRRNCI